MNKKIFFTLILAVFFLISICSYSLANTNAGNKLMNAGKSVGNAIGDTAGAIKDGARDLTNGANNMMNNMTNANGDRESDATNTIGTTDGMFNTGNGDYTATRTTTGTNNLLGMSDNTWTWLIVGIVGAVIVGLVWYYGSQFEHRNYNND